jgi:hypothetical protein
MKPKSKPPGTKRLKLKYDEVLSNVAFNFNLRRYIKDSHPMITGRGLHSLTSELNLRTFGFTPLTLELNLSTFGTHPRVDMGYMGDKVS